MLWTHPWLWYEPIHGRTTCQPVLTTFLQALNQHEAIKSRSRQLLMMGTRLSETCWATIRREIKNTKSDIWLVFLIHTKLYYLDVCTSNKAAVIPMEESIIYMSKNGEAGQIKLREHVYCFLWQRANASRGVYSPVPNCESTVLRRVPKTLEKDVRRRIPDKSYTHDRLLCHDAVPAHTLSSVQRFWTNNIMALVTHLSAFLNCLLVHFHFPKDEIPVEGRKIQEYLGDSRWMVGSAR